MASGCAVGAGNVTGGTGVGEGDRGAIVDGAAGRTAVAGGESGAGAASGPSSLWRRASSLMAGVGAGRVALTDVVTAVVRVGGSLAGAPDSLQAGCDPSRTISRANRNDSRAREWREASNLRGPLECRRIPLTKIMHLLLPIASSRNRWQDDLGVLENPLVVRLTSHRRLRESVRMTGWRRVPGESGNDGSATGMTNGECEMWQGHPFVLRQAQDERVAAGGEAAFRGFCVARARIVSFDRARL